MADREHVVSLFERALAAPTYNDAPALWDELLQALNLDLCYQPAISKVLKEGRWRGKENPKAYVATAAVRQARSMHLLDFSDREFRRVKSDTLGEGRPTTRQSFSPPNSRFEDGERIPDIIEGASADGGRYARNASGAIRYIDTYVDDDYRHIPEWLQRGEEYEEVDWETVAVYAVQKPKMARRIAGSLIMRFDERIGRPAAVARARTLDDAREIEAAWKWVDRYCESRIAPLFRMEEPPHQCEPPFESNIAVYRVIDSIMQVELGFTQLINRVTLRLDIFCQWDGTTLALVRRGLTPAEDGSMPACAIEAATLEDALCELGAVAEAGEESQMFHHWPALPLQQSSAKMSQIAPWTLTYIG